MKAEFVTLAVLTLVGGCLRFVGVSFGIPGTFRPDEEYMIGAALNFHQDWNPHFAIYPTAQMYVQHAALWLYAAVRAPSLDFRSLYSGENYPIAHVVARAISATFGAATIPAIYFAGAPTFGVNAAITAAAIVAFSTIHVLNSKFATADIASVFWVVLAIAMLLRIRRYCRISNYLGAGLFAGLATATKYPAAAVIFGILSAHFGTRLRARRTTMRIAANLRICLTAFTMAVVFFCASPYVVLDWAQTSHDYAYQKVFVMNGISAAGFGWRWLFLHAMRDSFGVGLETLMVAAIVWAFIRRKPGSLACVAFILVCFAALLTSRELFYRYILVPFPAMALLSGILIADLVDLARSSLRDKRGAMLVATGFLVLLLPSFFRDVQLDLLLRRTDTRILALEWVKRTMPRGTEIAEIDPTTPYGKVPLGSSFHVVPFDTPEALRQKGVKWVISDSYPPLFYSRGPSKAEIRELSSQASLALDIDPIVHNAPAPVYDSNDAFYVPLRHLSSVTLPGPRILIWRLK